MLSPGRAFQLSGSAGLVAALLLGLDLARHRALSPRVVIALWIVAILTFLGLAMATKILTRRERLIYYHHEIAVTLSAALFLKLSGRPVLPYLDILAAGLGLFLACGRIGCLAAGCCYGRPSRRGIRYGDAHVHLGFPR
ncbi:MAG TPA: prolipoprotein diacylglyceryl transferase family protein, partial [Edaphobacter sp.]|nr:prolipoprotein diacylglyceryl transferase family protein [Edaphobacter sp.]